MSRCLRLILAVTALVATPGWAAGYRPPRLPDGHPDLQGLWDSATLTALERDPEFKTLTISDAAAADYERRWSDPEAILARVKKALPRAPDVGYSEYFEAQKLARIAGVARTSILIDPPDGKLPIRPEARARLKARRLLELRSFNDPEARPLGERCLVPPGPPLLTGDTLQILQTRDTVVIAPEGGGAVRIVRLGDRRHGPAALAPWMGDSVGWWEGDTLVVETTGFNPGHQLWLWSSRMPISPQARVTERFSRTGAGEILYRFTVEDPANYAQPWSGVLPLTAYAGRLFEIACHEGNYSIGNILAGARRVEADGGVPEPIDGGDPPPKPAG